MLAEKHQPSLLLVLCSVVSAGGLQQPGQNQVSDVDTDAVKVQVRHALQSVVLWQHRRRRDRKNRWEPVSDTWNTSQNEVKNLHH